MNLLEWCYMYPWYTMSRMFDPAVINSSEIQDVANGSYWAFQKLGQYYHVGDTFLIIYALCNDQPVFSSGIKHRRTARMLLDKKIPSSLSHLH